MGFILYGSKGGLMKLKNILLVCLGSFILAFGLYNFHYQNNITEGGILGILLLIKHVFNVSPSYSNIIIDFTLFAIGAKVFGKHFLYYSLLATVSFSISYRVIEMFNPLIPILNNLLITAVLAGLFVGVGVGLVIIAGGAAGGDDVIALIGAKIFHCKISQIYLFTDITVLTLSFMVYLDLNEFICSLVTVCVSSFVIERLNKYKVLQINQN